jgi:hypothetical protein
MGTDVSIKFNNTGVKEVGKFFYFGNEIQKAKLTNKQKNIK